MRHAYLILGTNPTLSWAEVANFLSIHQPRQISDRLVELSIEDDSLDLELYLADLVDQLGGTVKSLKELVRLSKPTLDQVTAEIVQQLIKDARKIVFSYVSHGHQANQQLTVEEIKQALLAADRPSRYIEPNGIDGVSAAVLLHSRCVELQGIWTESEFILTQTIGVQDIDAWTFRDRSKPYANHAKGMLPPKLARIMVNLAYSLEELALDPATKLVYDPFCGTGTVLLEAVLAGYAVVGSDIDGDSTLGSKKNLSWFAESLSASEKYERAARLAEQAQIVNSDAVHIDPRQLPGKIDAIVTEPFLGKQTPRPNQVDGLLKGLSKLYLGAFKQWCSVLKPGAKVVMIWPAVHINSRTSDLSFLIDKLVPSGYTLKIGPLAYARPGAVVQRQVMVFEWQPK